MRTSAALAALLASTALANERFLAAEVVDALPVKAALETPRAPEWKQAHTKTHQCAAQRSVRLTDRDANAELKQDVPSTVTVRAAFSDTELSVMVEWKDATKSLVNARETASFGDAVAIELPVEFGGHLNRLPHIGMGDDQQWVYVYLLRATESGPQLSTFVGGGFGSLTRTKELTARGTMEYDADRETWRAVFVRPLTDREHAINKHLLPVGFALWEGGREERGGNKYISSWKFIRMQKFPIDQPFYERVSWGYGLGELGDPIKGKQLFEVICVACHWTEQRRTAPVGLAPDLSSIGIYQLPFYIRDSIVDPNQIIVHHLQLNRAYEKSGGADPNGAYPNSQAFAWFNADAQGNKTSRMPPFAGFPKQDIADIVAYLKTLDGTIR